MKNLNFMKIVFVFILAVVFCLEIKTNVEAAEPAYHLPKGWHSLCKMGEEETYSENSAFNKEKKVIRKAPAPGLTSLAIIDLALDDNDEIHVVTHEVGTSKWRFTYWNGSLCQENLNETEYVTWSDGIIHEYTRYYHTGIYYDTSLAGMIGNVTARATNAMNPWNELSASRTFEIP